MNTVHFVRHGENPANLTREFSHRVVDYPLTERGVAQAQATARHFRGRTVAAIYSSPLLRAQQTAAIIGAALQLPVRTIEGFREVNVGRLELSPPCEEHWALHDRIFADWLNGQPSSCFPDGEDHVTLVRRMRAGLIEALRDRDEQEIIIVAHGGALAATVGVFCPNARAMFTALGQAPGQAPLIPNCAITRLRLETHAGVVRGALDAWAECGHLDDHGDRDDLDDLDECG